MTLILHSLWTGKDYHWKRKLHLQSCIYSGILRGRHFWGLKSRNVHFVFLLIIQLLFYTKCALWSCHYHPFSSRTTVLGRLRHWLSIFIIQCNSCGHFLYANRFFLVSLCVPCKDHLHASSTELNLYWTWNILLRIAGSIVKCNINKSYFLQQFFSSERSKQSSPPSHFQLLCMHSPLLQWNSIEEQGFLVGLGVPGLHFWGNSSEPSVQSASPSHTHSRGTHCALLHLKEPEPHVVGGQETSSLPSSQSVSPSHTNAVDTHWPLMHRNSPSRHFRGAVSGDGGFQHTCTLAASWRYTFQDVTHHSLPHPHYSHSLLCRHTSRS